MKATQNKFQKLVTASSDGFSLLEVAMALAIMGIVVGFTIPPLMNLMQLGRVKQTERHQHIVLTALASYAARHGHLPCPTKEVLEGIAPGTCETVDKVMGYVPYQSLGIDQKYAYDGYRQPIGYAINPFQRTTTDENVKDNGPLYKICHRLVITSYSLQVIDAQNNSVFSHRGVSQKKSGPLGFNAFASKPTIKNQNDDYIAVVLKSTDPAIFKLKKSDAGHQNTAHPLTHQQYVFSNQPSTKNPYRIEWVSRDFLMAHYGHVSCPKIRHDQIYENKQ